MNTATLEAALCAGQCILLDSSTLIAYFDGNEQVSPIAAHIIDDFVRSGRNPAVVSMVSVMEVLVRPLQKGSAGPHQHILDFLSNFPNLRPVEIDLDMAEHAAALRAAYGFRSPDALVIATGLLSQVGFLVTNDGQWQKRLAPIADRVAVCDLGQF